MKNLYRLLLLSVLLGGGLALAQEAAFDWDKTRDFILVYPSSPNLRGPVPLISYLNEQNSYRSELMKAGIKWDKDFKKSHEGLLVRFVAVSVDDKPYSDGTRAVRVWHSVAWPPAAKPSWSWAGDFDERRIKGPWWKRVLKVTARVLVGRLTESHHGGLIPQVDAVISYPKHEDHDH